ncbi:helix-turn-helix domain-containing protein [Variovorax paradoxus]|uniref:helix-turn-helix domain-containing protein n=1 Tax=Variovorax paradoxus TaxID=34073 RepID=UPI0024809854|nr:helix-turn-helix transcriptional regulator [Variovorax paradoxus]WGT64782.1 helix-turn-helix transcriptional regulator [Variovorax paradoxus]
MNIITGHNNEFAQRLIGARTQRGWTQRELASNVQVSKRTISQYETGDMFPRPDTLQRLADQLHVDPTYLATGQHLNTLKYLADQKNSGASGLPRFEMLYVEDWNTLAPGFGHTPVYSANPQAPNQSADMSAFTPILKLTTDQRRAARYPGSYPASEEYPPNCIVIMNTAVWTADEIEPGSDVVFKVRGTTGNPGLRRVSREPGINGQSLVAIGAAAHAAPLEFTNEAVEIIGVVVSQVISRLVPKTAHRTL